MLISEKCITKGIQQTLSPLLQVCLWNILNERIAYLDKVDYLQVFNLNPVLKDSKMLQEVNHTQEVPKYSKTILLCIPNPIKNKIFVIRSQHKTGKDYWTMMLAEEY